MGSSRRLRNSRIRRNRRKEALPTPSVSLLSINGKLRSLYYDPDEQEDRSTLYTPVEMGKPLVVRYLRFYMKLPKEPKNKIQEVMVSSFLKTDEQKNPAAETVNLYDPKLPFTSRMSDVSDFGGDRYGHELIYYTKSYVGEPLKLTTKIMELDNPKKVTDQISAGIQSFGNIPFFAEFLPYTAIGKTSLDFIGKVMKLLDRDDPIVPGLRLDLFQRTPNRPVLQSGRVVCIQGKTDDDILSRDLSLNNENYLVDGDGDKYEETSYFVIQINSEKHDVYEEFGYFQNAAELLNLTNRSGGLQEFVDVSVDGIQTFADMSTIHDLEDMQDDLDDEKERVRYTALFKTLSSDVKEIYREKYERALAKQT